MQGQVPLRVKFEMIFSPLSTTPFGLRERNPRQYVNNPIEKIIASNRVLFFRVS